MKLSEVGKGTYAAINFADETLDLLQEIQKSLDLYKPVPRDKLHCTIAYSRVKIPYQPQLIGEQIGVTDKLKVFDTKTGERALVILIDSDYLHERFKYAMALGATYDFPDYQPHVTLSYDIGQRELPKVGFIGNPIIAASEYVQDLDLEWTA
ncbi:RNA ligase [Acinetobacter phage vB_AbaM_Kimel]|uniref:Anti-CBASS protein Acb1 n=3 Tax=Lazarusvirus kimel TaxID=2843635 RepID=A0A6B9LP24_9CAUD|nr:RNA ligase [Acinetobacter phage vB_AbaM_Kimel]QHB48307.1 putative RNA 2',3'-cyclic phosphodiesterase [Acinetobacter phage vB_AbaM_Kimel]QKE55850.1 putative RNA 2',3'-cyclic phosphodiesterase [Acinetobacter phage Octan]QNO11269.1 putative RNA 2',3'-cyclic phosphodiesterase [Acinetobacter phage Meroveus]